MFTSDLTKIQGNYYPPDYTDNGNYPFNIYNNFHHHHYYCSNIDNYQNSFEQNWIRKYDNENQKEYFTANTPSPAEFCDFELPQVKSNKSEVEKYYYDTPKASPSIATTTMNFKDSVNNFVEYSKPINSELNVVNSVREENVKINQKNSLKRCKSPISSSSDLGGF